MKQIGFLILLCSFSYNLHGFEIGTIKLSQIIDSSKEYGNFISNFENIKKKIFDNLNNIENNLNQKKEDIENSKITLTQDEYDKIAGANSNISFLKKVCFLLQLIL